MVCIAKASRSISTAHLPFRTQQMGISKNREPQNRPQYILSLIAGTTEVGTLIVGSSQIETNTNHKAHHSGALRGAGSLLCKRQPLCRSAIESLNVASQFPSKAAGDVSPSFDDFGITPGYIYNCMMLSAPNCSK